MLSQRAIDRRNRYNISIDYNDVPIYQNYINILKTSPGITVKAKSKWLNAIHVLGLKADIDDLEALDFVEKTEFANKSLNIAGKTNRQTKSGMPKNKLSFTTGFNYGNGANQIEIMKGRRRLLLLI